MSKRPRLPLAPERPARAAPRALAPSPQLNSARVVLALSGHESHALAFAFALQLLAAARERRAVAVVTSLSPHAGTPSAFRAAGACAALATEDILVGGPALDGLKAWLSELPREAWVITAGSEASALIAPTFSVGLGKRHEMAAAATDLWLGQSSERVAAALVEALSTSTQAP